MADRPFFTDLPRLAGALLLAACACTLPGVAAAQYQWRDASGQMVYSDQPPASGTAARDVRQRDWNAQARTTAGGSGAPAPAGDPAAGAPATGEAAAAASAEAGFEKRRKERQQAEVKQAQMAAEQARKDAACRDARERVRVLEAGGRIATVTDDGQRGFLDDQQIADRTIAARQTVTEVCGR